MLSAKNPDEAAKSIGVAPATLRRWLKLPEFEQAFREARLGVFRHSMARLQQVSGAAVTTLLKIMIEPAAPLAVKARCAYYILDQTRKGIETEDIEARVAELLERSTHETKA